MLYQVSLARYAGNCITPPVTTADNITTSIMDCDPGITATVRIPVDTFVFVWSHTFGRFSCSGVIRRQCQCPTLACSVNGFTGSVSLTCCVSSESHQAIAIDVLLSDSVVTLSRCSVLAPTASLSIQFGESSGGSLASQITVGMSAFAGSPRGNSSLIAGLLPPTGV